MTNNYIEDLNNRHNDELKEFTNCSGKQLQYGDAVKQKIFGHLKHSTVAYF